MINRKNFVFSKAAAARILGVPVHHITKIEWWRSVCWVVVRGKSPTLISYSAFKQALRQQTDKKQRWTYNCNYLVSIRQKRKTMCISKLLRLVLAN